MASFDFCINQAVKDKKITKSVAEEILASGDPAAAIKELADRTTREKREKVVDAVRIAEAIEKITSHPDGLDKGLLALLSKDSTGRAKYMNVDFLQKVYTQQYLSQWATGLELFRTKGFGVFKNEEGLNKFVRAVYGEVIDDPDIMKAAKEWVQVTENLRTKFNEVGGSINKNEDWLFPQHHDMKTVNKATLKEWKEYITPLLDRSKMTDDLGKPLDDAQLSEALDVVYETIVSGGMNKAKDFTAPRGLGTKLSRRGSEERFLYFENADGWINYQNKFGRGDTLTTLTDYIQAKASDIAMVEVMGTNPKNMFLAVKAYAEKQMLKDGKKMSNLSSQVLDWNYKAISGEANAGVMTTLADGFQGLRNIEIASKLGFAVISSITDAWSTAQTAYFNKFSGIKVLKRHIQNLAATAVNGKEYRKNLARMGFIVDTTIGRAHAGNRFADSYGTGWTAKTAEAVLRFSGLEVWTQSMRKAFSMEFSALLADNFKKSFDELDFKEVLERYGITKKDWDTFRKADGAELDINGHKFSDLTKDPSNKFHFMVLSEGEFATPTIDARTQAITQVGTERGTIPGQAVRSIMQIKSFPISVMQQHWTRGMAQATGMGRVAYLGSFAAGMTMMGAASTQLYELATGKEPRPMDAKFWGAAFMKGGAGGIFADLTFANPNKYGKSWLESLLGPSLGTAQDIRDFTYGNIVEASKGEETNVLGDFAKLVENITPGVWQTQLFMDSMFDQWRLQVDPKYQSTLDRMVRQRQTEYGQEYWWQPGETPSEVIQDLAE